MLSRNYLSQGNFIKVGGVMFLDYLHYTIATSLTKIERDEGIKQTVAPQIYSQISKCKSGSVKTP